MSMGWGVYEIIDANKEPFTVDWQWQLTMPPNVEYRPSTLAELWGPDAYIGPTPGPDEDWPKNLHLQSDFDTWSNIIRRIEKGRYLVGDHRGIDTITYKTIVCRLDDGDDWGCGILKNLIEFDHEQSTTLKAMTTGLSCSFEEYLEQMLSPDSTFQKYEWQGKVMMTSLTYFSGMIWYFTDESDFTFWKLTGI